jgi:hypothetical protein
MWNLQFFIFFYPYPMGKSFESIDNIFFSIYMNWFYYIPNSFWHLPRKILNWIPNWQISISLSIQLCTLWIWIHILKYPSFHALMGLQDPFNNLCCVEKISIWPHQLRKEHGTTKLKKVYKKDNSFPFFVVLFFLFYY